MDLANANGDSAERWRGTKNLADSTSSRIVTHRLAQEGAVQFAIILTSGV